MYQDENVCVYAYRCVCMRQALGIVKGRREFACVKAKDDSDSKESKKDDIEHEAEI